MKEQAIGSSVTHAMATTGCAAMQTVAGLVLYAYLIRHLGTQDVAVWVTLLAAGMLASMADLGLCHALIRMVSVAEASHVRGRLSTTVETLTWASGISCGLALAFVYLTFGWWFPLLSLPTASQALAHDLLPWMAAGLWLNRFSDTLAGCLDGQQRFLVRSISGSAASLAGLALTIGLLGSFGIVAVGLGFVAQYLLNTTANLWMVSRSVAGLRLWWPRFDSAVLREGLRYGLSVQTLLLCHMVLESGAKLLLAGTGSLSAVTFFDLAFKIGKGLRGLLSAALRVLVPRMARRSSSEAHAIYGDSFGLVVVVTAPIFVGLLTAAPLVSSLILGHAERIFVLAVAWVLFPWLTYCMTDAALNESLASGRMRPAMRGHVLTVLLAIGGAAIPAVRDSWLALYVLVAVSIMAGSAFTLIGVHRLEGIAWKLVDPGINLPWLLAGTAIGVLSVFQSLANASDKVAMSWTAGFLYLVWFAGLASFHPAARRAVQWCRGLVQKPREAGA